MGLISYAMVSGIMDGSSGIIKPLSVIENGTYSAADYGCDGFDPVDVNVVSEPVNIKPLTITHGGTYSAADYGCDGFDPVNAEIVDRLKRYIDEIPSTLDEYTDTGQMTMNEVNVDDIGTISASFLGGKGNEIRIHDPETGNTVFITVEPYEYNPKQEAVCGYVISPDGTTIDAWSFWNDMNINHSYNVEILGVEWHDYKPYPYTDVYVRGTNENGTQSYESTTWYIYHTPPFSGKNVNIIVI